MSEMVLMSSANLGQKALLEGIGTFMLTFIGAGSIISTQYLGPNYPGLLVVALAHGIVLAIAVSLTMNITGGHINPAVTIGMLFVRKISTSHAVAYIASQLVGAVIGGVLLLEVYPASAGNGVLWGVPALGNGVSPSQGIFFEGILTFILVMAIFGTAVDPRAPKIGGFGVGLAIAVDIMAGGPFTGAAMNPARAIGPLIAAQAVLTQQYPWYVWWIGPIIGAIVASVVYNYAILRKAQ